VAARQPRSGADATAGRWRQNWPARTDGANRASRPTNRAQHPDSHLPAAAAVRHTDPAHDPAVRPSERISPKGTLRGIADAVERPARPILATADRALVRPKPARPNRDEDTPMRHAAEIPRRIVGEYRHGHIRPTDRRTKTEWVVPLGENGGAQTGEVVVGEVLAPRRSGGKRVRVIERLGAPGHASSVSRIAIHTHNIEEAFPAAALEAAERAAATPLGRRTDLRHLPLVTIDGEDARDFDDAVFAEPTGTGFRVIVAIADVAHYVRPGSPLDRTARTRGNSVYFPDRVVPMLPEPLANGWCSLVPNEDRGCLFADIRIDANGHKIAHHFGRGLMRSSARLTYEQVQRSRDAKDPAHAHLYAAFEALLIARRRRGTLDLDVPEPRVVLDGNGWVRSVGSRPRLDSERLIEELMIVANVAAAEELEYHNQPTMHRVHPAPSHEKLASLRAVLRRLGIALPPGDRLEPRDLERVLTRVDGTPVAALVNKIMLRCQSPAEYRPANIGHFGLALPRYTHFTSPIRRYADLLVHRALIRSLRLGEGGLTAEEAALLPATAAHVTATERRAQRAERDATDRYVAGYMADKIGTNFAARISAVTRFGLFVTVTQSGATGLVPVRSLPVDHWKHNGREHTLIGRRSRVGFRLAQEIEVRLAEANPATGELVFHILPHGREHRHGRKQTEVRLRPN
jgi:ribonuclease R